MVNLCHFKPPQMCFMKILLQCDMWVYIISILLQNRRSKTTPKEVDANDAETVLVDSLTEGSDLLMQHTLFSLVF